MQRLGGLEVRLTPVERQSVPAEPDGAGAEAVVDHRVERAQVVALERAAGGQRCDRTVDVGSEHSCHDGLRYFPREFPREAGR